MVDAAGATLLPGLWDMHTHLGEGDGLLDLAAGVLGARDLANDMTRSASSGGSGRAARPSARGSSSPDSSTVPARSPARPRRWRRASRRRSRGSTATPRSATVQVKLYSSLEPGAGGADRRLRARQGHARLGAHPGLHDRRAGGARRLRRDPARQHAGARTSSSTRCRTRARRRASPRWPSKAAGLDLASPEVTAFLDLLAERDTCSTRRSSIFEEMFTARPGEISPRFRRRRRPAAAARAPRLPRRRAADPRADGAERYALRSGKLEALVLRGLEARHPDRRRHRLAGRLRAPPRARALRRGRDPEPRRAAARHPRRRAGRRPRARPGLRPRRQARRLHPRRRPAGRDDERHPQGDEDRSRRRAARRRGDPPRAGRPARPGTEPPATPSAAKRDRQPS